MCGTNRSNEPLFTVHEPKFMNFGRISRTNKNNKPKFRNSELWFAKRFRQREVGPLKILGDASNELRFTNSEEGGEHEHEHVHECKHKRKQ